MRTFLLNLSLGGLLIYSLGALAEPTKAAKPLAHKPSVSAVPAVPATPSTVSAPAPAASPATAPLGTQIEDLKKASLELNRDLLMLEEDLLFPASTQIAVFLSLDTGQFFDLDSVKLTIDDQLVASQLYTPKQANALSRGGVQRLYLGNLKTGKHEITAFFVGKGPENREYKRGATYTFNKDQKPGMLELRIMDSSHNLQPSFDFKEWHL